MPPPKKGPVHDYRWTLFISVSYLVLGVVFASLAINLEMTFMPPQPLKNADTILQAPHIALFAAAISSIASSSIVMIGTVVLRHVSLNNSMVCLVTFGTAVMNMVAQLVCLGVVFVNVATHVESKNINDVKFVNGQFDTNGRQFTRETWSCMMGNLYVAQQPWSTNACSEYHYARYVLIIMAVVSSWIIGIAYWPVRDTLFGTSKEEANKV